MFRPHLRRMRGLGHGKGRLLYVNITHALNILSLAVRVTGHLSVLLLEIQHLLCQESVVTLTYLW